MDKVWCAHCGEYRDTEVVASKADDQLLAWVRLEDVEPVIVRFAFHRNGPNRVRCYGSHIYIRAATDLEAIAVTLETG